MGDQIVTAQGTFAENGGGLLLEALALGGVEVHGGDDEDGGVTAEVSGAEAGEELEAIDVGHHEIEDDDAGADSGAFFEGLSAIGGFMDGPAEGVELALEETAGVGVVIDDQGGLGAAAGGMAEDGARKPVDIDGFGEDLFGEEAAGIAVGIEDAEEDDGDAGQLRIRFEAANSAL